MSDRSSRATASAWIVLIIVLVPLIYLLSAPVLVKIVSPPTPVHAGANIYWNWPRSMPPWLSTYLEPAGWLVYKSPLSSVLMKPMETYCGWVYRIGH